MHKLFVSAELDYAERELRNSLSTVEPDFVAASMSCQHFMSAANLYLELAQEQGQRGGFLARIAARAGKAHGTKMHDNMELYYGQFVEFIANVAHHDVAARAGEIHKAWAAYSASTLDFFRGAITRLPD